MSHRPTSQASSQAEISGQKEGAVLRAAPSARPVDLRWTTGTMPPMRSPIHLEVNDPQSTLRVSGTYHHLSRVKIHDVGNTLSADLQPGGILTINDRQFDLFEAHCHTPSEHTIRGTPADLELHLVHQDSAGKIAVIGLLFDRAPGTHAVDVLITPPPTSAPLDEPLGIRHLLPEGSRRFVYTGTRTTPPLTQGVQWVVYEEVQSVGADALAAFSGRYGPNNHPIQPLNGRSVSLI